MAKHKEGLNILIGSRCRSTNLYESCISKFWWKDKIFKTSLTHHPRSSLPQVGCVRGANTFPNHNQSLTRKSLTKTSQPGFPSNPQLNTRWRLLTKSIPITERKTAIARTGTGMPRGVFPTCDNIYHNFTFKIFKIRVIYTRNFMIFIK